MELDFFWIGLGMAAFGYFIGNGLKNFKNPDAKDNFSGFFDDYADHELIHEKDIHHFIGISKEDATALVREHPNVPHIVINGTVYFPKGKLRSWLINLGEE